MTRTVPKPPPARTATAAELTDQDARLERARTGSLVVGAIEQGPSVDRPVLPGQESFGDHVDYHPLLVGGTLPFDTDRFTAADVRQRRSSGIAQMRA
jgi:hypothetical protein